MDDKLRKELFTYHIQNDLYFRRLAVETEKEKDNDKFMINHALIDLVLMGKVMISQDAFGELLFSAANPN